MPPTTKYRCPLTSGFGGVPDSSTKSRCIVPQKEKSQADRFKQAAKEVGADESEAAFEDKLRKLAKAATHSPKSTKAKK
jgi:hypothetical protein